MSLKLFRLGFARVHFGDDGLERSTVACGADTLFSALCIQALRVGGEAQLEQVVAAATTGTLRLTDLLPFLGLTYFVPKPLVRVESDPGVDISAAKKAAKRLSFVPADQLAAFRNGRADLGALAVLQAGIGAHGLAERVAIRNGKDDAEPYRVGHFTFAADAGLWFIAAGHEAEIGLVTDLLRGLTALGGERSSGYGTFALTEVPSLPTSLAEVCVSGDSVGPLMSLTTALPEEDEMAPALAGATYRLVRRGGFVASATYAGSPLRKRDIYKLAAGSVFTTAFDGVLADVANGGAHPVYSYAKPIFLRLPEIAA
jgi:CRISPR-associated protein Csm4